MDHGALPRCLELGVKIEVCFPPSSCWLCRGCLPVPTAAWKRCSASSTTLDYVTRASLSAMALDRRTFRHRPIGVCVAGDDTEPDGLCCSESPAGRPSRGIPFHLDTAGGGDCLAKAQSSLSHSFRDPAPGEACDRPCEGITCWSVDCSDHRRRATEISLNENTFARVELVLGLTARRNSGC